MARSLLVGGRLLSAGLALAIAGGLSLTGCSPSTKEAAKDTGAAVGEAAKEGASAMGEAAKEGAGAVGQAAKEGAGAVGQAAKEGAGAVGDAAKTAANATSQAALAPAINPVLDLLKKGEGQVKAGDLAAAATSMAGFQAMWDKASPVIRPLAGDKWAAIDTAAKTLITTFAAGAKPDAAAAGSAITGLMGPLSGLMGK